MAQAGGKVTENQTYNVAFVPVGTPGQQQQRGVEVAVEHRLMEQRKPLLKRTKPDR